jgi:hypothetical protein
MTVVELNTSRITNVKSRLRRLNLLQRLVLSVGLTVTVLLWLVPQADTSYYRWYGGQWVKFHAQRQQELVSNIENGEILKVDRWTDTTLARLASQGMRLPYYVERRTNINWLASLIWSVVTAAIISGAIWALEPIRHRDQ